MDTEKYQERLLFYEEKLRIDKMMEELSKKDRSELTDRESILLWNGNPLANFKLNEEYVSPNRNTETFNAYVKGMEYGQSLMEN